VREKWEENEFRRLKDAKLLLVRLLSDYENFLFEFGSFVTREIQDLGHKKFRNRRFNNSKESRNWEADEHKINLTSYEIMPFTR